MNKRIFLLFVLIGGIIVSVQSCKKKDDGGDDNNDNTDPVEEAYKKADGILGGQFYDEFYKVDGYKKPGDLDIKDVEDFANFYRCKQCHGWDLEGKEGAYIGRKPNEGRPNVAGSIRKAVKDNDKKKLFDLIKNTGGRKVDPDLTQDGTNGEGDEHPDYGTIFSDAQIWDIVKFLREEAFDVDKLYDTKTEGKYPDGTVSFEDVGKDGNAEKGDELFAEDCGTKSCHGAKGDVQNLEDKSLGYFMRNKPYETQHKAKFGHAGDLYEMPSHPELTIDELKDLMKACQDVDKYPDDPAL